MPNGIESYNIYKGAGQAMGEYESSLRDVEGVWGDVDYSREMSALKTQQRESNIDSLMAVAELGSTLYGGWKAKKEFKGDLTRAQQLAAKEIYGADYTPEQLEKVSPFEVGSEGESWEDLSPWQKMFQEKQYRFGEGEDSYTMGKADVTAAAGLWKHGASADISGFKTPSMMDEASGTDNYNLIGSTDTVVDQKTGEAIGPDWDAIEKDRLANIESARESYSKRKEQYDWLKGRGIIKNTPEEQMKGLGSEAAGDIELNIPEIDQYDILSDIDFEEQERRIKRSVYGQRTKNIAYP